MADTFVSAIFLLIKQNLCDKIRIAKQNFIKQVHDDSLFQGIIASFLDTHKQCMVLLKTQTSVNCLCVHLRAFAWVLFGDSGGFVFLSAITSVVALFYFWK